MNENVIEKPTFKKICFMRLQALTNFPYIEEDFDALTNYELLSKIVDYLNQVIANNNEQNEVVTDLYNAFNELYNYVNGEFYNNVKEYIDETIDNLDVQEEINNKLDEMIEDGTFDSIIARVLPNSVDLYFDTIEDLKLANLSIGQKASTLGYYAKYDGGGASYKIIDGTADNLFSYELTNGNVAELSNKETFNVLQVGAKRNVNFDNAPIFSQLFKGGLNNTTIYVPSGVYQTTRINYAGDNQETNNFKFIGIGNPTIKLIHPDAVKTTVETYSESYYVSKFIDTISTGSHFTLSTIELANNKVYYYLRVDDASILPDSLTDGLVIEGITSGCKAIISKIDKADPDGAGTARIYLFETYNDKNRLNVYNNTSNTISENLGIKEDLSDLYLYIRFNDNTIPTGMVVNSQIEQIANGHKARVDKTTTIYESIKFVKLNCMPEESIFTNDSLYLIDNTPFNINTYTDYTAGMLSLNKYTNSEINGITFDGGNLEVSKYESSYNNWNTLMTGACKNIVIKDCNFNNSIMAGIQTGGIGNINSPEKHDLPENVIFENCHFYNNGRGDLEIIFGKNLTVSNCVGTGTLDIETNATEILDNINIDKCNFWRISPYSPGGVSSACFINISNSKFFTLLAQGKTALNLVNVKAHQLQPQIVNIKGTNCEFNMINGLWGNECLELVNSTLYGLYKVNPSSSYGKSKLLLENCIIDLSLSKNDNKLYTIEKVRLNNCIVISSTTLNTINDNVSYYECYNTDFKNIKINGIVGSTDTLYYKSIFDGCRFLSIDNTAETSESILGGNIRGGIIKNCYIETNILLSNSSFHFINCILNHTTKTRLRSNIKPYYTGLVSDDGNGISWRWVETGTSGNPLKFDNIQFSVDVLSNLGIKNGSTAVDTNSVSDGCRGYYVGATDKALVRIYHDDTSLALKEISFT